MKKTLVAAILGLTAAVSVQAQGFIQLYNYSASTPTTGINNNLIVYGPNSGGTLNDPVAGGFTVGMYYFVGDNAAAVNGAFGSPTDIPTGMTFGGTGTGASANLGGDGFPAGTYGNYSSFGGALFAPGNQATDFTVTIVVVAFNGADYASSLVRGHSQAFTMTAKTFGVPDQTGAFMNGFAVTAVPEPSTFALAGLGLAGLLIFRRRK